MGSTKDRLIGLLPGARNRHGNRRIRGSSRERLNVDVTAAVACLKPVPVSSLFRPEAYAAQATGSRPLVDDRIDPLIAAAYGPDTSSH